MTEIAQARAFTGFVVSVQEAQVFVDGEIAADYVTQLFEPLLLLRRQCLSRRGVSISIYGIRSIRVCRSIMDVYEQR